MSGDLITVKIGFRVVNFGQDKSGGLARVHIVQDLQTFDPSGNMIPQLSAEAIKEVQESKLPHYDYADFSNTLNIPATYPPGTYTARLIVNDRIGNVSTFTTANFEIP